MRSLQLLLVCMLQLGVAVEQLQAGPVVLTPSTGLANGDTYHLVFVTSTEINAFSPFVSVYDEHVQAAANAAGIGIGSSIGDITWRAIVSTGTQDPDPPVPPVVIVPVNAVDHADVQGKVFRLDGTQIATGNADLFDGFIAAPINIDESGSLFSALVWTGSRADGLGLVASSGEDLRLGGIKGGGRGDDRVGTGTTDNGGPQWIINNVQQQEQELNSLYAISEPLTFGATAATVPEPSSLALLAIGAVGLIGYGWRRKRKLAA